MKIKMMESTQDTMIKCRTAAIAALAASSLLSSAAMFNTAQAETFNANFYLNHYDDLKAAFGDDTSAAGVHWETYGIAEGRRGSTQYDGGFYQYLYPDIVNVHGSDYRAILTHWNISGINEGQRASREFDAPYYLSQYPDLQAAFGDNYAAAHQHWLDSGMAEGRNSSREFNVQYYLSQYVDLQNAFGNDHRAATRHYAKHGIKEGQRASERFDVQYYVSQYPDLQAAFGTDYVAATNHWIRYGIAEGRRGTADFDVQYYLNNNGDLQEAFGTNYLAAQDHAYTTGKSEGRIGSPGVGPSVPPTPAPAFVTNLLKAHNDERALYHTSMLQWSAALANTAQQWANTLAQENGGIRHSNTGNGENIYGSASRTSEARADSIYVDATQLWITEKQFYTYAPTGSDCQTNQVCGHFTQVIWKDTTLLGCGKATSQNADASGWYWTYVVCQYSAAGNVTGQHAY